MYHSFMNYLLFKAAAALLLLAPGPATAQAVSATDARAVRAVIEAQLEA